MGSFTGIGASPWVLSRSEALRGNSLLSSSLDTLAFSLRGTPKEQRFTEPDAGCLLLEPEVNLAAGSVCKCAETLSLGGPGLGLQDPGGLAGAPLAHGSFLPWHKQTQKSKTSGPAGFEPGTFHLLGERDDYYTIETQDDSAWPGQS